MGLPASPSAAFSGMPATPLSPGGGGGGGGPLQFKRQSSSSSSVVLQDLEQLPPMMASQQQSSTASAFLSSEGGGGGGYGQHRFSDGGARAGGRGSGATPLPSLPGGNANASIIAILESKLAQASHQLEAATRIKETTDLVVLLKETALAIDQCTDRRWRRSTSDFVQ